MDRNLFLAFALSFGVLTLWMMLTEPPPKPADSPAGIEGANGGLTGDGEWREESSLETLGAPGETVAALPELPEQPTAPTPGLDPTSTPLSSPGAIGETPSETRAEEIVRVDQPLFRAELTNIGAGLRRWELVGYRESPEPGSPPIVLTTGDAPDQTALVTPFDELGLGDLSTAAFELESDDGTQVAFRLERGGVTVRKVYEFDPDSYAFRLRVEVENGSSVPIEPRFAIRWPAHEQEGSDFTEQSLVALHAGSVETQALSGIGTPGFFGSLTGSAAEPYHEYLGEVDWAGVQTTYFLAAILPDQPARASARLHPTIPGKAGIAQVFFEPTELPPGQSAVREFRVYAGPKSVAGLETLGAETVRSIDLGYSWLAPLTRGFGWLLRAIYSIIPNYGVAIVVLTVLVRLVTAPLTSRQMRSMERMRALAPKLKELQAEHADDRQKQSEATMSLYRQEGVNPLGGCLPMVLQLPVFIGLFYALRSSIQLRQSPFFGWIDDLSTPETLFMIPGLDLPVRVLPLIMGATMVLQQKITPMQVDPAQARMMMTVMPVMMTFLFYQFPSGLVLYWMVSNVLAIGHQLLIGRRLRANKAEA